MRGRLINKFTAVIYRYDPVTTASQTAHGRSALDDVFREILDAPDPDEGAVGISLRKEMDPINLTCQIEPLSWKETQLVPDGDDPSSMIKIIFFRKDLETLGLIGSDGLPMLRKGDRLDSFVSKKGETVQKFEGSGTMYLSNIKPDSFGLNMASPTVNLLVAIFKPRPQGTRG